MSQSPLAVVKKALKAYLDKDREAIESVIAPDYRFTSPLDNAIDRAAYFSHCWPRSQGMAAIDVVHAAEEGENAWLVYELVVDGARSRNAEFHVVRGGCIVSSQVYFGWRLPHPVSAGSFALGEV